MTLFKVGRDCMLFIHREAGEELQMAEVKLAMHKEMLGKDEVGLGAICSE